MSRCCLIHLKNSSTCHWQRYPSAIVNADNLERLFEEAPSIVDSGDYDYELGSARLLGRDISKFAYTSTIDKLIEILDRESQGKRGHRIAMDALQSIRFAEESYEKVLALFDALLKGLKDDRNR